MKKRRRSTLGLPPAEHAGKVARRLQNAFEDAAVAAEMSKKNKCRYALGSLLTAQANLTAAHLERTYGGGQSGQSMAGEMRAEQAFANARIVFGRHCVVGEQ